MIQLVSFPVLLLVAAVAFGQPAPVSGDRGPLIFRDAGKSAVTEPATANSVDAAAQRLYQMMREIAQSSLSATDKQAQMHQLMDEHPQVFSRVRANRPQTADAAALWLQRQFFEAAAELAPDAESRSKAISKVPPETLLEPNRPLLIARAPATSSIQVEDSGTRRWWGATRRESDAIVLEPGPVKREPKTVTAEVKQDSSPPVPVADTDELAPQVAVLVDEKTTVVMHDDTTVLREVTDDDGSLVLFGAIHLWAGGGIQYDGYQGNDLFSVRSDSDSVNNTYVRRGEVILRATYKTLGELKLQYDLDSNIWRDLYWRQVDEEKSRTITIGNQDEPMGMEALQGNKFIMAVETSAPTSAFGAYSGLGVRLSNWFERSSDRLWLKVPDSGTAYITTSLGLFTQDIENGSDTDYALTGRVSSGRAITGERGLHLGASLSLREGKFDRIAPRPGIYDADRILLARPQADQQAVLGLEAMISRGSALAQAEFYFSDYRGGEVDAQGFGAYAQVGWLFGGHRYEYRPRFGLMAPISPGAGSVFEAFAQVSYTRGDDDLNPANNLGMLTLGGSWYIKKFRTSINAIYSEVGRDIAGENSGLAAVMRVQYLF